MINLSDSRCIIKGSRLDLLSELTTLMHELRDVAGFDDENFLTCMKVSKLTPDQALEAAVNKFKEMVKDTKEQDDIETEEDTDEEQELEKFDKFMDDMFNRIFH